MLSSLICHSLGLIGGFFFLVGPAIGVSPLPLWMRRAVTMAGAAVLLWAILGLVLLFAPGLFPADLHDTAARLKLGSGGAAIGLLFYVLVAVLMEGRRQPAPTSSLPPPAC